MKYISISIVSLLLLFFTSSCSDKYELSTAFDIPTELNSPTSVALDVITNDNIVLSWTGGGADDGSYVTYEVLFDKGDGNFSNPIHRAYSDLGVGTELTINHSILNTIARKAGIKSEETGNIIWTVLASKAGEVRESGLKKSISVTRGEGIEIPEKLYLVGTGSEGGATGLVFREAAEGVYVIYTKVSAGDLVLKSGTDSEAISYHIDGAKLKEGDGTIAIAANANPQRITIDFNTLSIKTEVISGVRCIWGATFDVIGNLAYMGNGIFKADNCEIKFIDQSRPETNPPSWLGWTEERYYFIATVNGGDRCWGRHDAVSGERPVGGEPLSFYELIEFGWSQWDHLWKMSGSLDYKKCTITIDTNKEGMMVHEFSNVTNI